MKLAGSTMLARRCAVPLIRRPSPRMAPPRAGGVAPMTKEKTKQARAPKDALFLLDWVAPTAGVPTKTLTEELKMLEKVSKEAKWFTVKEGAHGSQHVLMVTNNAKKACKYGLMEITESTALIDMGEGADPVVIPVAELKAAIMQDCGDSSSSDSEDEDGTGMGMAVGLPMFSEAKSQMVSPQGGQLNIGHGEQEEVGRQGRAAVMPPRQLGSLFEVEEDPAVRAQAEALLAGVLGGGKVKEESVEVLKMDQGNAVEVALDLGLKDMDDKQAKQARKAEEKAAKQQAKMAKAERKAQEKVVEVGSGNQELEEFNTQATVGLGLVVAALVLERETGERAFNKNEDHQEGLDCGATSSMPGVQVAMVRDEMGESSESSGSSGSESEDDMEVGMQMGAKGEKKEGVVEGKGNTQKGDEMMTERKCEEKEKVGDSSESSESSGSESEEEEAGAMGGGKEKNGRC